MATLRVEYGYRLGWRFDSRQQPDQAAIRYMLPHQLPYDLLTKISNRIINEVRGINRVVYDISGKATGDD